MRPFSEKKRKEAITSYRGENLGMNVGTLVLVVWGWVWEWRWGTGEKGQGQIASPEPWEEFGINSTIFPVLILKACVSYGQRSGCGTGKLAQDNSAI